MKKFEWKMANFFGEVEAENMKEALHKLIDIYMNFPYVDETFERIDLYCREKE